MGGAVGFFDAWARLMLRHRALVLLGVVLVTGVFGFTLTRLPMLTSLADVVPRDENFAVYEAVRNRFGSDEVVLVALRRDDHFTAKGLERLENLAASIEAHPLVEDVLTFTRADHLHLDPAEPDTLRVEPFYEEGRDPGAVRAAVLGDELVRGDLVSADGRVAVVVVRLVPAEDRVWGREQVAAYVEPLLAGQPGGRRQIDLPGGRARAIEVARQTMGAELHRLAAEGGYSGGEVFLSGFPVVFGSLLQESEKVVGLYLPLCVAVLALTLLVLFRRVTDMLLPLVCTAPAVVWAMGIGGLIFERLTIITAVAPVMVLVVGMSDVVHLMTQFHHEIGRGHARNEAIRIAFREVGIACTLTSLTTFIGFGSMALLPLPHARELGVFAGLGVVTAFILAFALTPVVLSFTRLRPEDIRPPSDVMTRGIRHLAAFLRPRPGRVFLVGLGFTALTLVAVAQVRVENALMLKFPTDHPLREAGDVIQAAVEGTGETEVIIDTGAEENLKNPDMLAALLRFEQAIEALPESGRVRSVADLLGRMHRLLAPHDAHPLPATREQIAQYLLLFELGGGRDLDQLADPTGRYLRLSVRLPYVSAERAIELADHIEALARTHLPAGTTTTVTGMAMLAARAGPVILSTCLQGLAGSVVLIALVMGLLFGSISIAVLSIIPNIAPVAFGLACVWLLLPQVDADTMVYLTICIGIAVDDTIHFLTRFRLERAKGLNRADATAATLHETGHGILRTSIILIAGFSVNLASDYLGLRTLGLILPATLLCAVVLDLTVTPAMAQLGMLDTGKKR